MTRLAFISISIVILMTLSCNQKKEKGMSDSQGIPYGMYHGGTIITMEGDTPTYVETVVVHGGKIAFVGLEKDALQKYGGQVQKMDLRGATLLPAFLDGHGHIYNVGLVSMFANVLAPPDGPGADVNGLIHTLNAYKGTKDGKWAINKFGWILGNGYDDSQLVEKDHPKASDLDKISTELPVLLVHQSGHLGVVNTKGLELLGWTSKETPNPSEGKLRRDSNGVPNGVLEENAFFMALAKIFEKADAEVNKKAIRLGQDRYAEKGYLTAQEGRSTPAQVQALMEEAEGNTLYLDVVSYPDMRMDGAYDLFDTKFYTKDHSYFHKFRLGGVKLTLDGSPQGKTAWLTQHYHTPPQGEGSDYKGYPIMSDEQANTYVADAFKNHWQILCHTNGDAAIDQYLNAIENAQEHHGYENHRSVIIHGQTIRKDQIERAANLKVDASLFPMHTFYWGDWHMESVLGHPRADYISPCRDAIHAGLNITSHHDAPVTFPNSMRVLDATVNRVTRSGQILGPDQKLTPYEGLKTLTEWAAIQYFEEDVKGTLTVGKLADFVILDKNPLRVNPMEIHDIKVLESIKEGSTVYKNDRAGTH